jgi:hypothetical protein
LKKANNGANVEVGDLNLDELGSVAEGDQADDAEGDQADDHAMESVETEDEIEDRVQAD